MEYLSGLNDYDTGSESNYVKVPTVSMINIGTSKVPVAEAREKRGWFYHQELEQSFKEITAVPLTLRKISSYSEGQYPSQRVVCRSADFFSPSTVPPVCEVCRKMVDTPRGRKIVGVCPNSIWTTDLKTGKKRPPACKETSVIVFKDLNTGNNFQMFFKGMNLYQGSPYMEFIKWVKGSGKDLYCFSVKLVGVGGETVWPDNAMADKSVLCTFTDRCFLQEYDDYRNEAAELRSATITDDNHTNGNGGNAEGPEIGSGDVMTDDTCY